MTYNQLDSDIKVWLLNRLGFLKNDAFKFHNKNFMSWVGQNLNL